jgi:hypothetical protein
VVNGDLTFYLQSMPRMPVIGQGHHLPKASGARFAQRLLTMALRRMPAKVNSWIKPDLRVRYNCASFYSDVVNKGTVP